jgi:hypothetical protein
VAWGPPPFAQLLLDLPAPGEPAEAVSRDERVAVARPERRDGIGSSVSPLTRSPGAATCPLDPSAKRRVEHCLGPAAGARRRLNSTLKTVTSGMMSALALVMLQRAYARPRPSGSPDAIAAAQQLLEPRTERVEERHHRPVRSRRSDVKIAAVKGAAFSRACASVMDAGGSLRRLSSHIRHQHRYEDDYQSGH